ncbi:hypothetical protein PS704_01061 [Pseudomonas fluorescens]|uniref:Uncharacterized protein n=1 Tax=Pseudomonas fluorescens TaxID=294 RepID=A0A5E7ALN1_PSEFL|nr:hypothetical protein PS704_01061 [Pseudomonas fluorescens]
MNQFGTRQLWNLGSRRDLQVYCCSLVARGDASHSLRKQIVCQRRFTVRPVNSRRMQIRSDIINVYAPREEFF